MHENPKEVVHRIKLDVSTAIERLVDRFIDYLEGRRSQEFVAELNKRLDGLDELGKQ